LFFILLHAIAVKLLACRGLGRKSQEVGAKRGCFFSLAKVLTFSQLGAKIDKIKSRQAPYVLKHIHLARGKKPPFEPPKKTERSKDMEEKETKKAQRKRPKQVGFFLSEEEEKQLEKKIEKSKLPKGEYLRKCVLEKEIVVIEDFKYFFSELKKQGNNLNQIAKAVNGGRVIEVESLKETLEEYKKINELIREFVRR
jgi:hypothetical protein